MLSDCTRMSRQDPPTWIFPPAGAQNIPWNASAAFGPVHKGDSMELVWVQTSQMPEIIFTIAPSASSAAARCSYSMRVAFDASRSHQERVKPSPRPHANQTHFIDATTICDILVPTGNVSPFRTNLTIGAPLGIPNATNTLAWLQFGRSGDLNRTVAFLYSFRPLSGRPQLWQQDARIATALAAPAPTVTATVTGAATTATADAKVNGLQSGAVAGIGVGAGVAVTLALAAALQYLWRLKLRRARERHRTEAELHAAEALRALPTEAPTMEWMIPHQLDGAQRHELTSGMPAELGPETDAWSGKRMETPQEQREKRPPVAMKP